MGEVGCYTLDLYCDCPEHRHYDPSGYGTPHQFTGNTRGECVRQAKREGWIVRKGNPLVLNGTGFVLCPAHKGYKPKDDK